jgi:L-lactate dehydrogenase complex protein LldG
MNSREKILEAVLKNQPQTAPLPDISMFRGKNNNSIQQYMDVFRAIGGSAFLADGLNTVKVWINEHLGLTERVVTTLPELSNDFELLSSTIDPHTYHDVELAIIKAHFGVAENGAVWLTDDLMTQRIIP